MMLTRRFGRNVSASAARAIDRVLVARPKPGQAAAPLANANDNRFLGVDRTPHPTFTDPER